MVKMRKRDVAPQETPTPRKSIRLKSKPKAREAEPVPPPPAATPADIERLEALIKKLPRPEVPKPTVDRNDIVRLERVLREQTPPDLTPLEERLRAQEEEIRQLRDMVGTIGRKKPEAKPLVDYHFKIERGARNEILRVTATAQPRTGAPETERVH